MGHSGGASDAWGRTAEEWARRYVESSRVQDKLAPPPRPPLEAGAAPSPLRLEGPGRATSLRVRDRAERIPKAAALREASARARLLHVFLHHEIQAAELSAWAVLAFPDTPLAFRRGLLKILDDEVRHAGLYSARLGALGTRYGDHAVRDWFWERTLGCTSPVQYLALMGLGFEGGNLEHAQRFEAQLGDAGDPESAALVARVGREEVAHVHFASTWFCRLTGRDPADGPRFEDWAAQLPPPLTPAVLRGLPLDRERRERAGLSAEFLDRLERCAPTTTRSGRAG